MNRQVTTGMGCELLKLLRDNRLSCRQIAELLAHGFLLCEQATFRPLGAARGFLPMLYTVAPAWRSRGARR